MPLPAWTAGVHPDWLPVLEAHADTLARIDARLAEESGRGITHAPAPDAILRSLRHPLASIRIVIVGQDPYPTPGHAVGLAFATERSVRPIPRSLVNIYRELDADLGIPPAPHGDLSSWAEQGVFLLNSALTVRVGEAGSHLGPLWKEVAGAILDHIAQRGGPLVAILWGRYASWAAAHLGSTPRIESAHPSPLSAHRGFFGSRPFSRANALLVEQGAAPIEWRIENFAMTTPTFRPATTGDAATLLEIYNHYVRTSTVTFDLDEWLLDDMEHKIRAITEAGMPFLIAEVDGDTIGYGYLSTWRDKCAYESTRENTVYLREDVRGRGFGGALLEALCSEGEARGVREVIAVIADTEDAVPSVRLHEKHGFDRVGAMPRVGRKFDRWIGVVMLQRSLRD